MYSIRGEIKMDLKRVSLASQPQINHNDERSFCYKEKDLSTGQNSSINNTPKVLDPILDSDSSEDDILLEESDYEELDGIILDNNYYSENIYSQGDDAIKKYELRSKLYNKYIGFSDKEICSQIVTGYESVNIIGLNTYTKDELTTKEIADFLAVSDTDDLKLPYLETQDDLTKGFNATEIKLYDTPTFQKNPLIQVTFPDGLKELDMDENTEKFIKKFQTVPKYLYSKETLEKKSEIVNSIRSFIKSIELTEADRTEDALIQYAQRSQKDTNEYSQNLYHIKRQFTFGKNLTEEEKRFINAFALKQNLFYTNIKTFPGWQPDDISTFLRKYPNGVTKSFSVMTPSDDLLLHNKRLVALEQLAKKIGSENSLESNYNEFKSLYEKNGSPKDLGSILSLINYHINVTFPAMNKSFSQDFLMRSENDGLAHYLPAMTDFKNSGVWDNNGDLNNNIKKMEQENNNESIMGMLPLDMAVATGVGVCQQACHLAKYILDELSEGNPDVEYLASYISVDSRGTPISEVGDLSNHFDLMIFMKNEESGTEVVRFDPTCHKIILPPKEYLPELAQEYRSDNIEIKNKKHCYVRSLQPSFPQIPLEYKVKISPENLEI